MKDLRDDDDVSSRTKPHGLLFAVGYIFICFNLVHEFVCWSIAFASLFEPFLGDWAETPKKLGVGIPLPERCINKRLNITTSFEASTCFSMQQPAGTM